MVKLISSELEFQREIQNIRLVVVDFYATWCGPCKQISPFIEQLQVKYPAVTFLKVDVDQSEDLARAQEISAMPTFKFFIDGRLVEELKGADPNKLESLIVLHNQEPKNPSDMSVKELKAAIVQAGLASKVLGLSEKHEFVELLKTHYSARS